MVILIPLVINCENSTMEYNVSCWHCNPKRDITPHPTPPKSNECEYMDFRPTIFKPFDKKPKKQISKKYILKTFKLTDKNRLVDSTKKKMDGDILYSRQRIFMKMFGIDILNTYERVEFHRIMKNFMRELDYISTDKQDVMLFYTQEACQELYDVYIARNNKMIQKYTEVFNINLENYDDVLDFMQLVKLYIQQIESINTVSITKMLTFLKENNPNDVYLGIKMKNLKIHT